jgi:hypothetical protein
MQWWFYIATSNMPPALKKCKDCGAPVSKSAPTCPQCGAVLKRKSSCLGSLVAVFLLLIFVPAILSGLLSNGKPPARASSSATSAGSASTPTVANPTDLASPTSETPAVSPSKIASQPPPKPKNWRYGHSDDQMSKGRVHQATTTSTNVVEFDFPYRGSQRGMLTLRTHPKYGKDVIFNIERGQLLVRSYENSSALVRFDDADPISFKVVGAEDHSSTSAFFMDYQGFVSKMMKSKRVRISIPVYQQGSPVFEFDVISFDADSYLEKEPKTK